MKRLRVIAIVVGVALLGWLAVYLTRPKKNPRIKVERLRNGFANTGLLPLLFPRR